MDIIQVSQTVSGITYTCSFIYVNLDVILEHSVALLETKCKGKLVSF